MGTEAAFLVDLQHEFLQDASGKVTECLDSTADMRVENPEPLRFVWTAVHTLKGEAGVVGFPHLLKFLSNVEDAFTVLESKILETGGMQKMSKEACARLASSVREVFFALEDYIRVLTRDYLDKDDLYAVAYETCQRLEQWSVEGSSDWGMESDFIPEKEKGSEEIKFDKETAVKQSAESQNDDSVKSAFNDVQKESELLQDAGTGKSDPATVELSETAPKVENLQDELDAEISELNQLGTGYNFDVSVFAAFKRGETIPFKGPTASNQQTSVPSHQVAQGSDNSKAGASGSNSNGANVKSKNGQGPSKADPSVPQLYLMVHQDGGMFALPLMNIVEIVQYRKWNALPVQRKKILGVLNLRGAVLPIFDLHEVLGAAHLSKSTREERIERLKECKCIVVVQVESKSFGFVVEMVSHVTEMRPDHLYSADKAGMGMGSSLVAQMGLVEGKTVLFLDVKGLVA
jgi:purine-binding chemotaxis protein CheW